jgi:uncharacterized protein (TIGR03032 family)
MTAPLQQDLQALWAIHNDAWRDPMQVISHWQDADVDSRLLRYSVHGDWWETLKDLGVTLLVTREYEHLVMAMRVSDDGPALSFMKLPHPSGMTFDREGGVIHIACTRNPNQIWDLAPVTGLVKRLDTKDTELTDRPLLPMRSRTFPGFMYLHDLAMIGGQLHANSVGQNAVVRLGEMGDHERVWWPQCIEREGRPVFEQNYIQLNSIAAGSDLRSSYFSASTDTLSIRRPGHRNFPVDKRGVVFSGATREPVASGLTRPHSARLRDGRVWVDNSGYGELGYAEDGGFVPVIRLPGWTRGLCFGGHIAFVGTSRVIPRFAQYAPGLNVESSTCGVHAIDLITGRLLGSLHWPYGNQIFAIEVVPLEFTSGFPVPVGSKRAPIRARRLMYAFSTRVHQTSKE